MAKKVLALGDSWFHYPSHLGPNGELPASGAIGVGNIIYYLHSFYGLDIIYDETTTGDIIDAVTHKVKSLDDALGCCGEELLVMTDPTKYSWLDLLTDRIRFYAADADNFVILLSAGGNDIAGSYLANFINDDDPANPAANPLTLINSVAFNNKIDVQLRIAWLTIFNTICSRFPNKQFDFYFHGYSYPPVNGRGVFDLNRNPLHDEIVAVTGNLQKLPLGPWTSPTFFTLKKIEDTPAAKKRNRSEVILNNFIDHYNTMLQGLASPQPNGNLHYVDLRMTPANGLNDDRDWCNELHLSSDNFLSAAQMFRDKIQEKHTDVFVNL